MPFILTGVCFTKKKCVENVHCTTLSLATLYLFTHTHTHMQETDVIVSQVLDELGISLDQELSGITPGLDRPRIQQSTGGGVSTV